MSLSEKLLVFRRRRVRSAHIRGLHTPQSPLQGVIANGRSARQGDMTRQSRFVEVTGFFSISAITKFGLKWIFSAENLAFFALSYGDPNF